MLLLLLLMVQLAEFEAKVGTKDKELSNMEAERDALGARVEVLAKEVEVRISKPFLLWTLNVHRVD